MIAYASHSISKSEKNYAAHKLEFLCLRWSVCESFMITCMATTSRLEYM